MKVATCLAAHASCVDPQDVTPQKLGITPESSVNATQINIVSESKEPILDKYHQVEHMDADKAE